mgnify:CR=1 FL=1
MSINMFDRELDNLKELLTMAMNAVIADSLEVETDRVHPDAQLVADLGMSPVTKKTNKRNLIHLRLSRSRTIQRHESKTTG